MKEYSKDGEELSISNVGEVRKNRKLYTTNNKGSSDNPQKMAAHTSD